MECRQITQTINDANTSIKEFTDLLADHNVTEAIRKKVSIEKELEPTMDFLDPDKIRIRDVIAKKFGFDYVGLLSGGVYMGEKKIGDSEITQFLINEKGDTLLTGPLQFRGDPGEGKFLVYENYPSRNEPYGRFLFIDKTGQIILDLGEEGGKDRSIHFPSGGFEYSQDPLLIHYFGNNKVSKVAYLCPNGKLIVEKNFCEETASFSEGYVWIKNPTGVYELYDKTGNRILSKNGFNSIGYMVNGKSIAVKSGASSSKVFTIDRSDHEEDLNIEIDNNSYPSRHGDICTAKMNNKTFYFTTEGRILDIEANSAFGYINSNEGVFKVSEPDGFILVDMNGKRIIDETFNKADHFSEGLISVTRKTGRTCYMDVNGNFMYPETTKNILLAFSFEKGCADVLDEDGWFLIDMHGKDLFLGNRYKELSHSSRQGVFNVTDIDENKFYVDKKGRRVFS